MPTSTYPGVYIEEVPGGVRTITGVATSITAFIGRTNRGPVNEPISIFSFAEFEWRFGGLWLGSPLSFAVRDFFLNGGGHAIIVRLFRLQQPAPATDVSGSVTIDMSGVGVIPLANARIDAGSLLLEALSPGAWGNGIQARIDHQVVPADGASFNLTLRDSGTGEIEHFPNLSISQNSPRQIDVVLRKDSHLVRMASSALPATVPFPSAAVIPGSGPWDYPSTYYAASEHASDGGPLVNEDFITGAGNGGLHALDSADLFNLLCIPPHQLQGSLDGRSGSIDGVLIDAAVQYCVQRRAMLLIDPPFGWASRLTALDGVKSEVGSSSGNAALYFPAILQPNPLRGNRQEPFAPCGAVAGVIARTDVQRGIWKAPAGMDATLSSVPGLVVSITDAETGELNSTGINCLRAFPNVGRVVWGARTRRGDDRVADEWKYVPVRRTALFIEESIYRGIQWAVFEPNDEELWASIRLITGAFLQQLFKQGAFQGTSPRDAFFIKCDTETTTQADIDLGAVNILVGFAPLKPAEFVMLRIRQLAGRTDI